MIIWFLVLAPVIVAEVFQSQRLDYRVVAAGAVLPVPLSLTAPGLLLHTLLLQLLILTVVMLTTIDKRLVRRRWLGLPIGGLLHLILDGSWLNKETFWWPAFGFDLSELVSNEIDHFEFMILLDLLGMVVGLWALKRYGLDVTNNRDDFIKTGQLPKLR